MKTPHHARRAAELLSRAPSASSPTAEERDRAIAAIAQALRTRRQRRQARKVAFPAIVLAFAAAAAFLVVRAPRTAPVATSAPSAVVAPRPLAPVSVIAHPGGDGATVVSATNEPLVEGEALAPGSRIIARPSGRAILAFSTGTRLTIKDGGDVTLVDGGPTSVVALGHGSLRADVAKLHEHERFLVRTDDAEIEVRGTSFEVTTALPSGCAGTTTRVDVYEGVVVVRHGGDEVRLTPGDSWPPPCHTVPQAPPPRPATGRGSSAAPASSLGAQNDLFASAVAAKQRGDVAAASARFEEFVTRFPASPLAESAGAQRMKLLRGAGSPGAVGAATAYLARWPEGFAHAEAEEIVAGGR